MRAARTFVVTPPPRVVIEYLADFAHTESWDPGTRRCTRIGDGPVQVGSEWHNVSEFRGKQTELHYRLEARTEDHLLFRGTNKTATSTDDLTFTASGNGTRITYVATIRFHGLARLADPLLRRGFEQLADETVAQLTSVLAAL